VLCACRNTAGFDWKLERRLTGRSGRRTQSGTVRATHRAGGGLPAQTARTDPGRTAPPDHRDRVRAEHRRTQAICVPCSLINRRHPERMSSRNLRCLHSEASDPPTYPARVSWPPDSHRPTHTTPTWQRKARNPGPAFPTHPQPSRPVLLDKSSSPSSFTHPQLPSDVQRQPPCDYGDISTTTRYPDGQWSRKCSHVGNASCQRAHRPQS